MGLNNSREVYKTNEDIFGEGPSQLQVIHIYKLLFEIKMKFDEASQ